MGNKNAQGNTVIEENTLQYAYKAVGNAMQTKRIESTPKIKYSKIFEITGLLPFYQSRVENGRWESELDNLFKMTASRDMPVQEAFADVIFSKPLPITEEARTGNFDKPHGLTLSWIALGLFVQGIAEFLGLNDAY